MKRAVQADVTAHLEVMGDLVGKCEEIIEEHKHKCPPLPGKNSGNDERYRIIPADQYDHMECMMSAVWETIYELGNALQGGKTVQGLISLLEKIQADHGSLKVFCGDMEELVVEIVEAEDKERYGDKYLHIGNGCAG